MTEFLGHGRDWHLRSRFFLVFHFSPLYSCEAAPQLSHSMDSTDENSCGFAETFPDIPCVSQMHGGPSLRRGDTNEDLNIPSSVGCLGNNFGRLVTWEFPLRTDSVSWKSLESFIQFTSFCNSCTLPDNSKIVFWSSMSFRLASVSNVELWNFRNSSISVRLCWLTSRNFICCRHNTSLRIRRSSSAWVAWSLWWPIFSQYSAIIICLCSSSKVLICAFELFRSSGFPDLSTTFSAWGVFRKLAVSTVRVSRDTKTNWLIDISFFHRFPCSIEHNRRRLTDRYAFWIAAIGLSSVCLCEQLAESSRHPCPGPMTG